MYVFAWVSVIVVIVVAAVFYDSLFFVVVEQEEEEEEGGGVSEGGDDVVLHPRGAVEKTEEDEEAEDEFEALLSKTMSESVERTKIARATTQVGCCSFPNPSALFPPSSAGFTAIGSAAGVVIGCRRHRGCVFLA